MAKVAKMRTNNWQALHAPKEALVLQLLRGLVLYLVLKHAGFSDLYLYIFRSETSACRKTTGMQELGNH